MTERELADDIACSAEHMLQEGYIDVELIQDPALKSAALIAYAALDTYNKAWKKLQEEAERVAYE